MIRSAAIAPIARPVRTDPVNATFATDGCSTSAAPATSPVPSTTLNTPPSGNPASVASRANRTDEEEVNSEGLTTTVFPAASAGATARHA